MKVYVCEYICGGGWPREELCGSLATEGGAMLSALCEDLARLPDVTVTTTLDVRCDFSLPSPVQLVRVDSPTKEREVRLHHARMADATFVIAPELDNTLARIVHELRTEGVHVVAPPDGWIEICSDKRRLAIPGVPMIPTFTLEQDRPHGLTTEQVVIKPAFGAGSQTISVLPVDQLERLRTSPHTPPLQQLIVQPFIPGTAVSVGVIVNAVGQRTLLPIARQRLSDDGYLSYRGGQVPWSGPGHESLRQTVRRCLEHIPDLNGYIGLDFVVPDASPDRPLLVEINPRLCTSYLGYRRLTDDNLAALMLPDWPKFEVNWKDHCVEFQPDGTASVSVTPEDLPCT